MPVTLNTPTPLALSLPALAHGAERALAAKPLPEGVSALENEGLSVTRGKSSITLSRDLCETLKKIPSRARSHIFKIVPKVACALFAASRLDHLSGLEARGELLLCPVRSEQLRPLRRLTRLSGLDPDRPEQVEAVQQAFLILAQTGFTFTSGELVASGPAFVTRTSAQLVAGPVDDFHRGGMWQRAKIAPELFEMSLKRFVPMPLNALEMDAKAFNLALPILAQSSLRRSAELNLKPSRLVVEGALSQTTTRGRAREETSLKTQLAQLVAAGLLKSAQLVNGLIRLVLDEPSNSAANEHQDLEPCCASSLDPRILLHAILNPERIQWDRRLLGSLVRSLERSLVGASARLTAAVDAVEWRIGPAPPDLVM